MKWWGERNYGQLLRPASCIGRGPALSSTVFYAIRCSRERLSAYLRDAATLELELVDEMSHRIFATASIDLMKREAVAEQADNGLIECMKNGPVPIYSRVGAKLGVM